MTEAKIDTDLLGQIAADLKRPAYRIAFSPAIEEVFLRTTRASTIRRHVYAGLVGLACIGGFGYGFQSTVPDVAWQAIVILCGTIMPLGLVATWLMHKERIPLAPTMFCFLLALVLTAVYLMWASRSPGAPFIAFTLPLMLVFGNLVLPLPFLYACLLSFVTLAIGTIFISIHPGFETSTRIFTVMINVNMVVYTLFATYRIDTSDRRAFLLTLQESLRADLLAKQNEVLNNLSNKDGLTGVFNRRFFDATLDRLWQAQVGTSYPVTLLMIDIDHFKRLNDVYGHQQGDICLRAVTSRLQSEIRPATDILARYGGEEFAVICPGAQDGEALRIAERLRGAVEAMKIPVDGEPGASVSVTISIGCAVLVPGPAFEPAALVSAADHALYVAKRQGRNRVCAGDGSDVDPVSQPPLLERAAASS